MRAASPNVAIVKRQPSHWPTEHILKPERSNFSTPTSKITKDFAIELQRQRAVSVILHVDFVWTETGWPDCTVGRAPLHAVLVELHSQHESLSLACNQYDRWSDNLRSITLSLRARRLAQQHKVALGSLSERPTLGIRDPYAALAECAGVSVEEARAQPILTRRNAMMKIHPDHSQLTHEKAVNAMAVVDEAWKAIRAELGIVGAKPNRTAARAGR